MPPRDAKTVIYKGKYFCKTMNNKILLIGAAVLAVSMESCKDDQDFGNGALVPEGTEIQFGAGLVNPKSRTYYGSDDLTATSWPIYWNYEAGTQDEIFIYSPQALDGRNQGVYRVDCTTQDKLTESNVIRVSADAGVQASDATSYNFYGLYPAKFVQGPASNGVIKANLPGNQSVTFGGTKQDPTLTVVPAAEAGAREYVMKPNMDYCIMTGMNENVEVTADQKVTVPFTPFASMLDITVNGPDNNTVVMSRITSVIIEANAPISGDFEVDFNSGSPVLKTGDDASNVINIQVRGVDADGDPVGIPLMNGNTLNLKAFILPNSNVTDIKVKVVSQDMKTWTKTLHVNNGLLKPHEIHPVNLPILTMENAKMDYSIWLSQLDPRIYITELSLPGSCLSYNYSGIISDTYRITQGGDIAAQFNAGARVFQAHCWLVNEASSFDQKSPTFHITTNIGDTGVSLWNVVQSLQTEMEENHGNEFCVLMLSDESISGSKYTLADCYERFLTLTTAMKNQNVLPESAITPNTTIADVRGKIILKLSINATSADNNNRGDNVNNALGALRNASALNGAPCLFNMFAGDVGSKAFYCELPYGQMGSFDYTPCTFVNKTLYGQSIITLPVVTSLRDGINTRAAQKIASETTTGNSTSVSPNTGGAGNANSLYTSTEGKDFNIGMWFIYGEQANAGANHAAAIANINNVVSAIADTYSTDTHNKFYMTYACGKGRSATWPATSYTVAEITGEFNGRWMDQINAWGSNVNRSYGWVMFNDVTGTIYTTGTTTQPTTPTCITKVIENNVKEGYKLNRDRTRPAN